MKEGNTLSFQHYARGSVQIELNGLSLEKFLNAAAEHGLRFWDAQRITFNTMTAWMNASDFKELRTVLKKTHCKIKILQKQGMPFILWRYRVRRLFVVGALACIFAVYAASRFVWHIEIEGNNTIQTEQIMRTLSQYVKPGTRISQLDMTAIERAVVLDNPDIAWAGTRLNGTRLTLSILEGSSVPSIQEQGGCSNIVAVRDAMVSRVTVFDGVAVVAEGDQIKAGDILISGTLAANMNAPERYIHATGEVLGRVWYTGEVELPRVSMVAQRTGNIEQALTLYLGNQRISLQGEFAQYDAEEGMRYGVYNLYVPLEVVCETRYEVKETPMPTSEEEVLAAAEEQAWQLAVEQVPKDARIVDQSVSIQQTATGIRAVTVIETLENIGRTISFEAPIADPENLILPGESALTTPAAQTESPVPDPPEPSRQTESPSPSTPAPSW